MATYLKRTSKLFDLTLLRTSTDVNLCDLMCSVCRGILIEPVTLPCTHNLCLKCLKGTFEHNSLSCPLCRIRVGSWLRTATKSETLVNSKLWELIRMKFPKEVEDKYNGVDGDIEVDAGLSTTSKILSAAGEIRREYEVQLQMVEEEMRRQREAAEKASEALIRKLHAEEQRKLVQLAQDELLAKTFAKKQIMGIKNEVPLCNNKNPLSSSVKCSLESQSIIKSESCKNMSMHQGECSNFEAGNLNLSEVKDNSELRRSNIALISKIRAERYASSMKAGDTNTCNDSSAKFCCQKQMPVHNAIANTLKHKHNTKFMQPSTSSYVSEPGCSTSKIYGTQVKEELHVPSDVLNSKKKSLGIEVCMTTSNDDERIGSAESAGSHDSINQEIHHFKPIKAMPRTPLKLSADGKHMDPKLIRVVPTIRRVTNIVPKPPTPTRLKRMIGCSWSAFRGKARLGTDIQQAIYNTGDTKVQIEQKPSTSLTQPQIISNKFKVQVPEAVRRADTVSELSFDNNKNYAKNINKIINGTKVSKRLILDEHIESGKVQKPWKAHVRNGIITKSKWQKNSWSDKADFNYVTNATDNIDDNARDSTCSSTFTESTALQEGEDGHTEDIALEYIAERIKKRKTSKDNVQAVETKEMETELRTVDAGRTEKKKSKTSLSTRNSIAIQKRGKRKISKKVASKGRSPAKRRQISAEISETNLAVAQTDAPVRKSMRNLRATTRHYTRSKTISTKVDPKPDNSGQRDDDHEYATDDDDASSLRVDVEKRSLLEDDVIKEQERIERLVLQEKEDFELAQRLQAQFDEMERVAGRTTRSRKAVENMSTVFMKCDVGRSVHRRTGTRAAKQSIVNQSMTSEIKKRGRPQKRVLK